MSDTTTTEIIGRIMDKAAEADRRTLFVALRAAINSVTNLGVTPQLTTYKQELLKIEAALDGALAPGRPNTAPVDLDPSPGSTSHGQPGSAAGAEPSGGGARTAEDP